MQLRWVPIERSSLLQLEQMGGNPQHPTQEPIQLLECAQQLLQANAWDHPLAFL